MTKLSYPTTGIYNYYSSNIENCTRYLAQALSNSVFNIPSEFVYKQRLSNLDNVISGYCKEIGEIGTKLKYSNDNFESLSDDLVNAVEKMTISKVKERERMII